MGGFKGFWEATRSDLVTPTGLPLLTISPERYEQLKLVSSDWLGIPVSWLYDILHVNAVELVQGLVPIVPLILAWSEADAERFAKLVGSLGVGTVIAANPLSALVAVVMIARGMHKPNASEDYTVWALGIAKDGAISGTILAASSVIAGPAWIELVAGAALGIWLNRRAEAVKTADVEAFVRAKLRGTVPLCS